ncbi:hypothetical protein [Brevibacillus reuszeri]|uniref:hypothetical protein n=1 Tax=Brevibacillus reuszeri TaxID=54915 RepID=UPI000CCC7DEC|nr:hypothetical protein [Brevibacillus reuszeri]
MTKELDIIISKEVEYDHAELGTGFRIDGSPNSNCWQAYEKVATFNISHEEQIPEKLLETLLFNGIDTDLNDTAFTLASDCSQLRYSRTEDAFGNECGVDHHYSGKQIYQAKYYFDFRIKNVKDIEQKELELLFPKVDVW